jgi:copper(I)-binding protein
MTDLRFVLPLLLASLAWSAEPTLTIERAWARATAPSAANGAVFFDVVNHGDVEVRITAASSAACATAELHGHRKTETGVQMYQLDALTVPAKGRVTLAPGGLHVMLMGLAAPLKEGATVTVDLTVAGASAPVGVKATVLGIAAMGLADAKCCAQ